MKLNTVSICFCCLAARIYWTVKEISFRPCCVCCTSSCRFSHLRMLLRNNLTVMLCVISVTVSSGCGSSFWSHSKRRLLGYPSSRLCHNWVHNGLENWQLHPSAHGRKGNCNWPWCHLLLQGQENGRPVVAVCSVDSVSVCWWTDRNGEDLETYWNCVALFLIAQSSLCIPVSTCRAALWGWTARIPALKTLGSGDTFRALLNGVTPFRQDVMGLGCDYVAFTVGVLLPARSGEGWVEGFSQASIVYVTWN